MLREAQKRNLSGFAITDHCDIEFFHQKDVKTPVVASAEAAKRLSGKGNITVFSGVEIGEGIWNPDAAAEVIASADFDVVLGSVHAVRYRNDTDPYSGIDFSVFSDAELAEYLKVYFEDVKEMAETMDFDVLAHLDCPLRYITGKYGRTVDMAPYDAQIEEILRIITSRSIALEINTAGSGRFAFPFRPEKEILERYRSLGGYRITLGSDAHVAGNVGRAFSETVSVLKELGFENAYYFIKRRPVPYAL